MKHVRSAFSRTDLVVTLVIVTVLAALFLPSILTTSRPRSRRSQCKISLKQFGLALHNYHETFNTLPPGWIADSHFGWNAHILPQLDLGPLFEKLNFQKNWKADLVRPATVLPVLRCPNDSGTLTVGAPLLPSDAARSSYPAVSGATLISSETVRVSETAGAFGEESYRNFREFKDGLSNAILVGERRSSGGPTENPGGDTIWIGVRDNHTLQGQALVIGDCAPNNLLNFQNAAAKGAPQGNLTGFGSVHTGGAQFLLGDGSVRFISNQIDPTVYANLATIDDGNPLGDF